MFWTRRPTARRVLIVAAAALIPALAGCEAGNDAPTLNWHYPTVGAGTVVHGISIRNVFVLGAANSGSLPAGDSAGLYMALVNNGNGDKLTSVTAPGTAKSVTLPKGGVVINRGKASLLSGPSPVLVLQSLTRTLTSGSTVRIVLTFAKAGQVRLTVPVLSRSQDYGSFSPAPSTSPSSTASAVPTTGATSTPTPTATAGNGG